MGITNYQIHLSIYTGQVLVRSGRASLTGSWFQLPNWKDFSSHWFQKVRRKISVFTNVPDNKLHTWVKMVPTTHASIEIQEEQFFRTTFQNSYFNYLTRPFFTHFCKTPPLSCTICFSLFLRKCLPFLSFPFRKGKFNFWTAFNFRDSRDAFRTPVKDRRSGFL